MNRYINHCDTFRSIKVVKHALFRRLKPLQLPHWPWDSISMDVIMGLPLVDECNVLWVIVDRLTKMAHFVPYSDMMKPEQLPDSFILYILRTDGLPNSIVSDRGSLFISRFWIHIIKALGTTRYLSMAFHPKTDRQTEWLNAIIEQYLQAYCNYQQDNWNQLLPIVESCYSNMQSETTKVTPFYANYGYHPYFEPDLGSVDTGTPKA
jgi:hypothetical protein